MSSKKNKKGRKSQTQKIPNSASNSPQGNNSKTVKKGGKRKKGYGQKSKTAKESPKQSPKQSPKSKPTREQPPRKAKNKSQTNGNKNDDNSNKSKQSKLKNKTKSKSKTKARSKSSKRTKKSFNRKSRTTSTDLFVHFFDSPPPPPRNQKLVNPFCILHYDLCQ